MKKDFPIEDFKPGETKVGNLIKVKITLRNGGELEIVDETDKLKIRQKLFTLTFIGRFNYLKVFRYSVNSISFSVVRLA